MQKQELRPFLQLVKGAINGLLYGTKIRFPHALVMTALFGRQPTVSEKLQDVLSATRTHAFNLAKFVFLFKSFLFLLRHLRGATKNEPIHYLLSGFVGGSIVFGDNNPINMQINLYLLSRVLMALVRLFVQTANITPPAQSFRMFAATVWALVMWLFYCHPTLLQPSLHKSMKTLYVDSNHWTTLASFFQL